MESAAGASILKNLGALCVLGGEFIPRNPHKDALTKSVIGRAIKVHRTLGPGLLESVYEECLAYELTRNGIAFGRQVSLPIMYEEVQLDMAPRRAYNLITREFAADRGDRLGMPTLDYSHLSARERIDLISEIWDSIDASAIPLTAAQEAELDRRVATLDEDVKQGRDAAEILVDLRRRYR